MAELNPYIRIIQGVTFIDAVALEASITKDIPTKHHLRQKMINAGVMFWDKEQTIVKKPVIGISSIGGFPIRFDSSVPANQIKLLGTSVDVDQIAANLRQTMGMQSSHTYMNPGTKTADELYKLTAEHQHFSMAHAASIGLTCLGISKVAELEFDVQRDVVYLARTTSARSVCQDEPTLVALSEESAKISKLVLKSTLEILKTFEKKEDPLVYREQRNALFPLSACVSLGITGSIRNLSKLVTAINDPGKELEFRNALALINDSLYAFLPELFKHSSDYGYSYPSIWHTQKPESLTAKTPSLGFFDTLSPLPKVPKKSEAKETILLLGAPGVGKSTQTERIIKQRPDAMRVSTGELVRKLSLKQEAGIILTPIEQEAAKSLDKMRRGELMDDKAVYNLLMEYLSPGGEGYEEYKKANLIILDGVVKAEKNIAPFHAALAEFNTNATTIPMNFTKVVNLSASPEELKKRQQARVILAQQANLAQRPDDDPNVYAQRLEKYLAAVNAVLNYYECHYELVHVNSTQDMEQTTQAVLNAIDNTSINHEEHMLTNTAAYSALVDHFDLTDATVIEFGAGDGALTELILNRHPKKVIAYELNSDLAEKLRRRFGSNPVLEIRVADFTKENFAYLNEGRNVIISNPPYETIPFLFDKVINPFKIQDVIMMTSPKKKEQYFNDYQLEFTLSGDSFSPPARGEHLVMRKGLEDLVKYSTPTLN